MYSSLESLFTNRKDYEPILDEEESNGLLDAGKKEQNNEVHNTNSKSSNSFPISLVLSGFGLLIGAYLLYLSLKNPSATEDLILGSQTGLVNENYSPCKTQCADSCNIVKVYILGIDCFS